MEGETVFAKRPRKSAKKINYSEELDDSDEFMGNENEEISKYSENSDQNESSSNVPGTRNTYKIHNIREEGRATTMLKCPCLHSSEGR